jgi:hypothetical protein
MANATSSFLHEIFMEQNKIYTGNVDPNVVNSVHRGTYLWMSGYEERFKPHLFVVKSIINETGFKRDFLNIKRHELFKDRLNVKIDGEDYVILVYPFSKLWEKRLRKLMHDDFSFLPKGEGYQFNHIIDRTDHGFELFKSSLREFNMSENEIDKVVREAKMDDRPLHTGFNFRNECINYTKKDQTLFYEWEHSLDPI